VAGTDGRCGVTAVIVAALALAATAQAVDITRLIVRDGQPSARHIPAHAAPRTLPLQLPAHCTDIFGRALPGITITDSGLMPAITAKDFA